MTRPRDRRTLHEPATYAICVQGPLGANWSKRFGGLTISVRGEGAEVVTDLVGQLPNQAALISVLTDLYDLGLPLVSLERIPSP